VRMLASERSSSQRRRYREVGISALADLPRRGPPRTLGMGSPSEPPTRAGPDGARFAREALFLPPVTVHRTRPLANDEACGVPR